MRRPEIPTILLSLVLVAGCDVGEVPAGDGGGGSNDPGEASFNAMIAPLVSAKMCAEGGCHSVQAPILTSYGALANKYKMKPGATNILVTKGDATGGTHSGLPYFTDTEKMTVAGWIDSLP